MVIYKTMYFRNMGIENVFLFLLSTNTTTVFNTYSSTTCPCSFLFSQRLLRKRNQSQQSSRVDEKSYGPSPYKENRHENWQITSCETTRMYFHIGNVIFNRKCIPVSAKNDIFGNMRVWRSTMAYSFARIFFLI